MLSVYKRRHETRSVVGEGDIVLRVMNTQWQRTKDREQGKSDTINACETAAPNRWAEWVDSYAFFLLVFFFANDLNLTYEIYSAENGHFRPFVARFRRVSVLALSGDCGRLGGCKLGDKLMKVY